MRIVLCDDHRLLLQALSTALANRGYYVEAITTTPAEAVRAVERCDPDVLLTDLTFPQGSGLDVAAALRESHARTKVVIITGNEDASLLSQALALGVSGYVLKGERIPAICEALEAAHRGDVTLDALLVRKLVASNSSELLGQRGPQHLTLRERDVLELLDQGLETHEIVRRLGVSQSTVRTHIQNILSKLGVHSRLEAVAAFGEAAGVSGVERA